MDGLDVLLYIGMCQAAFIILVLLSTQHRNFANKILVVWIFFLAIPLVSHILSVDYLDIPLPIFSHKLPYGFTFGPLLLLYTSHLTGTLSWTKVDYAIHSTPFILGALIKAIFLSNPIHMMEVTIENSFMGNLFAISVMISSLSYSIIVLRRLAKHKQEVLQHFSSLSNQITLKWLTWLAAGLLITSLFPIIGPLLQLPDLFFRRGASLVGFIYILSYFSLKQTQVFHTMTIHNGLSEKIPHPDIESEIIKTSRPNNSHYVAPTSKQGITKKDTNTESDTLALVENNEEQKKKYERSGLTEQKALEYLKQLEDYMSESKPYFEANLTIEKLAHQVRIPRHYLTQILSEKLDRNFYQFINEYRVNNVKRLIENPANNQMTLLTMAYESGFNSKSTFNNIFKKTTGMTPSQFRKSPTAKQ